MTNVFIIAEAGVNHNGSEELALELVDVAVKAGADAIKFQTFRAETLVSKQAVTAEYQKQQTGSDDQFSMLKKLEMSTAMHQNIIAHCDKSGIEFMSTPFDLEAASFLISEGMSRIKIPSGELTNLPFIKDLVAFDKRMILSTGMSSLEEVKESVEVIRKERKRLKFKAPLEQVLTILHCTSNYPTKPEDVNLNAVKTMALDLALPVGYSDHTNGTHISVAAVALGAKVIEKHFTLDKALPGPDHLASLEPAELELLVRQIRSIENCLGDGNKIPRKSELPIRDLVRRSVTLAFDKAVGDILKAEDLILLRPGNGIAPKYLSEVIGRRLNDNCKAGSVLTRDDLI